MRPKRLLILLLLGVLFMVAGCQSDAPDNELRGRIALWHSWSPAEAEVLNQALKQFQEIHPNVRIVPLSLPQDQMLGEFNLAAIDGLGPGILIGDYSWLTALAEDGLIRPLPLEDIPVNLLGTRNNTMAEYDNQQFGVPLSLRPRALYYNKNLVDEPARTVDELLQHAADGKQIAFVPRFEAAYWGIQAFGDGLFDADGRFTLADSGFTQWLRWLEMAQGAPGVIVNVDEASLQELFASGQIAYYVGGPEWLDRFSSLMSESEPFEIGVAPLPDGPEGPAGPLLTGETIYLYAFNSPAEAQIGTELAEYLTNPQQGIRFIRESDRIPSNPRVRVDPRIYPVVSGFAEQAKTAVILPNEVPKDLLFEAGNRAYANARSDTLTPTEAVCEFGQEVAAFMGYTSEDMDLPPGCELP